MQENKENFTSKIMDDFDTINVREEIEKYLVHWKWFVLASVISLSVAYVYLRYATPTYMASASIMIKDNNKSGVSAELAAFEDLGIIGGGGANNPENEIEILKSRKIIGNVVDSLNLDIMYVKEGRVKATEIYSETPIELVIIKKNPSFYKKRLRFYCFYHR